MSELFDNQLKIEEVEIGVRSYTLHELSAYDRMCYLEAADAVDTATMETGALLKFDCERKIDLVAYALLPGVELSFDDLVAKLKRQRQELLDALYEPAAKLSGLWVDPESLKDYGSEESDKVDQSKGE